MPMFTKTNAYSAATLTASDSLLIGPVDIKNFDKFSITYRNFQTAITFLDMYAQVASDPSGTAADNPPTWVKLSTATLEVPSALGATAVALSSRVDNSWNFLRVRGHTCQTAIAGTLGITITGFERR